MKYILDELFDPYRLVFYVIFAFALSFAPWVTMPQGYYIILVVLGAYLVLIVWIIARTIWLTIYRRMKRKSDKM